MTTVVGDCDLYGPFKTADEAHSYATTHGIYSNVIAKYRLGDGAPTESVSTSAHETSRRRSRMGGAVLMRSNEYDKHDISRV
jgi:hypothetical protein